MDNHKTPWAYFLTFRTYANFLHGDPRLSVDVNNNIFGNPKIPEKQALNAALKNNCNETPFILNEAQREITLQSMKKTCDYFSWKIFAAHVRSNHVHIILQSTISKEKTMTKLKAYATQALRKNDNDLLNRQKFWAVHGSTRLIWYPEIAFPALYYIVEEQGEPMALFYDKEFYDRFDPESYRIYRNLRLC